MKYTWRIFKYSKYIDNDKDKLSHCNSNIELYSQTIVHSQYDSQNIRKEEWLHIFMESNRFIEIHVDTKRMEINLNIHNPPKISITRLEIISFSTSTLRVCSKGRVLAFKFTDSTKKFQITFFNTDEANIFFSKFNDLLAIDRKKDIFDIELLKRFLDLVKDEKIHHHARRAMKTCKTKKELIQEFVNLVKK
ncbi:hypothetical protein P3W45_001414 [Vairimorpha bombi]|jgi:hypothetical protein